MRKATFIALLIVVSVVLGATVLREPIATAAAPITNVFVTNTAANPVPVREVSPAPQQRSAYFQGFSGQVGSANPVVPTVPAGQQFIVTYINVLVQVAPVAVACELSVGTAVPDEFASILLQPVNGAAIASEEVFIPIAAGKAVVAYCGNNTARVRMGGYFVPAS